MDPHTKESCTKEEIIAFYDESYDIVSFLGKVDRVRDLELSRGKWQKLYATLAEMRKALHRNIWVYESPNLYDYDVSCHKQFAHMLHDRSPLWMQQSLRSNYNYRKPLLHKHP